MNTLPIEKPITENLISGEKYELLCDLIIGNPEDITYNQLISNTIKNKSKNINFIPIAKLLRLTLSSFGLT